MRRTLLLLLLAASCTSYRSVLREFDSVAGYDRTKQAEPATLGYGDVAERYPWLVRHLEWLGPPGAIAGMFTVPATKSAVDEPASFARGRIAAMAATAGKDLLRLAEVDWRLLMIVEKDDTPLNRVFAVQQLERIAGVVRGGKIAPGEAGLAVVQAQEAVFQERAKALVATFDAAWPGRGEKRPAELRDAYATALRDLSRFDPGTLRLERSRLRAMAAAVGQEGYDRELQRLAARYLLDCVESATNRGLCAALRDPEPGVREASAGALFRLGGPPMVPWILARLEGRKKEILPAGLAATEPFDPDVAVRRKVLRLCWAIDMEAAKQHFGTGPSPLAVLVDSALRDPEPALRTLAREALAFHVRRPVDPTGSWIAAWWRTFVSDDASRG